MNEKKEMFQCLLNNVKENAKSFDKWFKQIDIDQLQKQYLYNLKRMNGKPFNQDIINYMYDLGIYFLYEINTSYGLDCQMF